MNTVCTDCFNNMYIKDYISNNGVSGYCSNCNKNTNSVLSYREIWDYLIDKIENVYEHKVDGSGAQYDSDTSEYYDKDGNIAEGESISEILENEECFADHSIEKNLLEQIVDYINYANRNDGISYDIYDCDYVVKNDLYGYWDSSYYQTWDEFKEFFKGCNEYSDVKNVTEVEDTISYLDEYISTYDNTVTPSLCFYRTRNSCSDAIKLASIRSNRRGKMGPPPASKATSQRMSPRGISYLYVSSDINTSLAEIDPEREDVVSIIKILNTRSLKIVDLTKCVIWSHDSIFCEDYDPESMWINKFLSSFSEEISRPVKRSNADKEYIAAQYVSPHIKALGYDGLCFQSSRASGKNYVFFFGEYQTAGSVSGYETAFTLASYEEAKIYQIKKIEIHKQKRLYDMFITHHVTDWYEYRFVII